VQGVFAQGQAQARSFVVQGLGQVRVVVKNLVDVVGVGAGLVLDPAAAGVPVLGVVALARAQALAGLA